MKRRLLTILAAVLLVTAAVSAASAEVKNYTIVNKTGESLLHLQSITTELWEKGGPAINTEREPVYGGVFPPGAELKVGMPIPENVTLLASTMKTKVGDRLWIWQMEVSEGARITLYTDGKYSIEY